MGLVLQCSAILHIEPHFMYLLRVLYCSQSSYSPTECDFPSSGKATEVHSHALSPLVFFVVFFLCCFCVSFVFLLSFFCVSVDIHLELRFVFFLCLFCVFFKCTYLASLRNLAL